MWSVVGHPLLLCWKVTTTSPPSTETFTSEIVTVPEQPADALDEEAAADVLGAAGELLAVLDAAVLVTADELLAVLDAAVLPAADELLALLDGDADVWPLSAQATAIPTVENVAAIAPTATMVATRFLRTIENPRYADMPQVRSSLNDS